LQIKFVVEAWEQTPHLPVEELLKRLKRQFKSLVVDRERGDAHVQAELDQLVRLGATEVILESHKSYFGNVVFVLIDEISSTGATATSYLQSIWPPLGDAVWFDVKASDKTTVEKTARELAASLGMVICSIDGESYLLSDLATTNPALPKKVLEGD